MTSVDLVGLVLAGILAMYVSWFLLFLVVAAVAAAIMGVAAVIIKIAEGSD